MERSGFRAASGRTRAVVLGLVIAVVAVGVGACGGDNAEESASSGSGSGSAASSQDGKGLRLGLVLPDVSNPFINAIAEGAKAEAKKQGADILIKGSNEPSEQVSAMENYIGAGVDALGFNSIDAKAIGSSVENANAAGIPVFSVVSSTKQGKIEAFISADFNEAGKMVGDEVAKNVCADKNPCRVAVVQGALADEAGLDGDKGFRAGLAANPNAEIVADQATNYDATEALNATQTILTANHELDFIHAWWSAGTLAVVEGIKTAGNDGKVGASSLTGACPVLEKVLAGEVDADAMMFPEIMGREFVQQAIKKVRGGTVEPETLTASYLITPEKAKALLAGDEKPPAELPEVLVHLKQAEAGDCDK
jgi:ABC-type sugar transport system substrate-binding protein